MSQRSIEDIYGPQVIDEPAVEALLSQSLHPRGPSLLLEKMQALGLHEGHYVLDLGCRDARHSCELVERFGCRVLGLEPIALQLARAETLISEKGLGESVSVIRGFADSIPASDEAFDFIWCRDVLNHVPELPKALIECARVLRPHGVMLVFQSFATASLSQDEAERLYGPLSCIPENMSPDFFEAAAQQASLSLWECDVIQSEWREWAEERGLHTTSKQLLSIARLQRGEAHFREILGDSLFEVELANCYWGVYQMLGKLCARIYTLKKR